jgi:hypothetical protein
MALSPQVIADTLGALLKYQDDIAASRERPAEPRHIEAIARSVARIEPPETMRAWFAHYAKWHSRRCAQDLRLIDDFAPEARAVVEFGVVPPILTGALAERGLDFTGVDVAPERFASTLAGFGCQVVKCDIETEPLPFPDARFDLVVFNEIFEHLRIDLSSPSPSFDACCARAASYCSPPPTSAACTASGRSL